MLNMLVPSQSNPKFFMFQDLTIIIMNYTPNNTSERMRRLIEEYTMPMHEPGIAS